MERSNGCSEKFPKFICDGEIEIVRLTEEYYEEALEIYSNYFMKNENICIATNIKASKEASAELIDLCRLILKDNVSYGAKHLESNRLAAICINKILDPETTLEDFFVNIKSPEMIFIGEYLDRMENTFNIYKNLNIDCCMEVVFLSTRPEFERKGIARSLTAYSIEMARDFGNGLLSVEDLPKAIQQKRPKAVCSIFTTRFTQIIGEKLGFEEVVKVPYAEIVYNGSAMSEKLNPIHVYSVFAVKKL